MITKIQMRRGTTAEWAAASPVVLAEGEPGWDSTLKGMKVGDGSTEWAALPWIDAKNRPDINANTLDGVHLSDIRLGQNILHNWDFRNPVNQRGVSGAISTGTYFFDRWIRNSGTVTVNAGYLTLASGAVVEQRIEGNLLAGLICTVSFEVGGTIYHGSGAFPTNNGTVSVEVDGYPDITLGCATGYMFVLIPATSETSIKRVKCEMGFVSTLHLDPPMDHAVEVPKCHRYYWQMFGTSVNAGSGVATSNFLITCNTKFPVAMRISPTVSIYNGTNLNRVRNISTGDEVLITTMNMSVNKYGIYFIYDTGGTPFTVGAGYDFGAVASADL